MTTRSCWWPFVVSTLSKGDKSHTAPQNPLISFRFVAVGRWQASGGLELTKAIESFHRDPSTFDNSDWGQGVMNAALLGLTNVSAHMGIDRTTMRPGKDYRLNVFALPGQCPWTIYIISPGVVVGFCVSTQ